jgi:hypothetical protein
MYLGPPLNTYIRTYTYIYIYTFTHTNVYVCIHNRQTHNIHTYIHPYDAPYISEYGIIAYVTDDCLTLAWD